MNANWMFEEGHLVARNESGHLLRRWLADEAMGQGLALLLNHSNSLSRFLLWSLCEPPRVSWRPVGLSQAATVVA